MLYSCKTDLWKIGDFGFSSEVTCASGGAVLSLEGKGTPGFRAPELLCVAQSIPNFNQMVDIWALGCILYELISENPAFSNDWAVYNYYHSKEDVGIECRELPTVLQSYCSAILNTLLHRLPQERPSATYLHRLMKCYYFLSHESLACLLNDLQDHPTYSQLAEMIACGGEQWLSLWTGWYETNAELSLASLIMEISGNRPVRLGEENTKQGE